MKVVDTAPSVTADELRRALELRETIHRVARALGRGTAPAIVDLDRLNEIAAGCPPVPSLSPSGRLTRTGDLTAALVAVVRDALLLAELPAGTALKLCDDDTCRRLFVDRSRGNRRRWCEMANCGDRAKARAYRSRRRADRPARWFRRRRPTRQCRSSSADRARPDPTRKPNRAQVAVK
jgi:predicted RNA-binding Zn ribbon-like protein